MSWPRSIFGLIFCALSSCSQIGSGECLVKGVVVDVQDGEPLVGVRVEGPDGTSAVSDPRGHFILIGLEEGQEGRIRAWRSDGWEVERPLRPLKKGTLEIVLHLGPASD